MLIDSEPLLSTRGHRVLCHNATLIDLGSRGEGPAARMSDQAARAIRRLATSAMMRLFLASHNRHSSLKPALIGYSDTGALAVSSRDCRTGGAPKLPSVLMGCLHSIRGGVTMTTRILRVLCAVLAVLVWTATPTAAAVASRPFMAEFTGVGSFAPTSTPGVFMGTGAGSGHATHLGKVTVSISELLDLTVSPGNVTIRNGQMVMVAANGDELHWTYSGSGPVPEASGEVAFGGVFTITGGTGRFADATGSGTFEGFGSVVTGEVTVSYEGTIDY